jgi:hypothetical protein
MADLAQAAAWHRQVAALAAAADRAGVGGPAMAQIQARLASQQARFASPAAPPPALLPSPDEIAAAAGQLGDFSERSVALALQMAHSTLDAAEAALDTHTQRLAPAGAPPGAPLSTPHGPVAPAGEWTATPHRGEPTPAPYPAVSQPKPVDPAAVSPPTANPAAPARTAWEAGLRNALVYGGYSLIVLVVQILLFIALDEQTLPALAPVCLFVLPAFAWVAGWFTVGAVFRTRSRTPRLGAAVCFVPDLLLCAGVVGLLLVK